MQLTPESFFEIAYLFDGFDAKTKTGKNFNISCKGDCISITTSTDGIREFRLHRIKPLIDKWNEANSFKTSDYPGVKVSYFIGILRLAKSHYGININDNSRINALDEIHKSEKYKSSTLASIVNENDDYEILVSKSLADIRENRLRRISASATMPEKVESKSFTYKRNPDVTAEALFRAKGICQKCQNAAPFLRKIDSTPYLEVHHIVALSDGGEDSLENVIAICPNCHRQIHHG